MTYAELSEVQARRSRQFAEAQTDAMSVYCDAERDLKELQAENAKLREEFDKMDVWHSKELTAAMAENAKLRDLVRDLYEMAYPECPSAFEVAFADRMRELGVEVDA